MQSNSLMKQWWRLGGISGILFVVLFVIGAIIQGAPPSADDPVAEIRAFWVDDGENYLLGDYVIGLGFILFFLPFASGLRSLLSAAEGGPLMWSRLVFAGAVLTVALGGAASVFWTALAFGDVAANASDETITLLMSLNTAASHFVPAGLAIVTLSAALVILRTRALPVWLGVLSLAAGVLAVLGPLSILADNPDDSVLDWLPFMGAAIWVLVTSVVLVLKKDEPIVT